jgi:hypothetical protein
MKNFKTAFSALAAVMMLLVSGASQAVVTTYTDRTTWESNGSVLFTEDFESFGVDAFFGNGGSVDAGPFSLSATHTVTAANLIDVAPFHNVKPASFGNAAAAFFVQDPDTATLTFDAPVSGFFADFWAAGNTEELLLTLSLAGGGTANVNVPGPGNAVVVAFGVFSTDLIESILFSNSVNDGFSIDNISGLSAAVIPVPAAVWLFGTALLGLIGFGRRK